MNVKNFLKVDGLLATSGQPNSEQFKKIAEHGYCCVINLAMPDSDNAIANEGQLVTELGMKYVHIPVEWESPEIEQFEFFKTVLEKLKDKKVWVHCALNMRVSSFIYLYRILSENENSDVALARLNEVWCPNAIWKNFIERVLTESMG